MSAYYYSPAMGDAFVGALAAVGVLLFLYRGFSGTENWVLDVAGVLAVGVALVPTAPPGVPGGVLTWHGAFAVAFFACIAYICILTASDTLSLIRDTGKARALRRAYRALGAAMLIAPVVAVVLASSLDAGPSEKPTVFFVEATGVWVFAGYWLVKSLELKSTGAAQLALEGKLHRSGRRTASLPGRIVQVEPDVLTVDGWEGVVDTSRPAPESDPEPLG